MASSERHTDPMTMSGEDGRLLDNATTDLMKTVSIDGSSLLAELRKREAITEFQEQDIQVGLSILTMFIPYTSHSLIESS